MGFRIYPKELDDAPESPARKNIVFGLGVVATLAIFYYGISYLNASYPTAKAEEKNTCTINYNRATCLDYIEQKLLKSLAKMNIDDYTFETRVSLLQALAIMHCPDKLPEKP